MEYEYDDIAWTEATGEVDALQCARADGLSLDIDRVHPLNSSYGIPLARIDEDDNYLPALAPLDYNFYCLDALFAPRSSINLLNEARDAGLKGGVDTTYDDAIPFHRVSTNELKLELPILRTDPELDQQDHQIVVDGIKDVTSSSCAIPLVPQDEAKDETLEFPAFASARHQTMAQNATAEKLLAPRATMMVLHTSYRGDWTKGDNARLLAELVEADSVSSLT